MGKSITLFTLLLLPAIGPTPVTPAQIDPVVQELVRPVLKALCAWPEGTYTENVESLGRLLAKIEDNSTQAADEAVVVLLDYGLDAAFAEDLIENIASREEGVVPFLRKYRAAPTWGLLGSDGCLDPPRLDSHTREDHYLWLADRLDKPEFSVTWAAAKDVTLRVVVGGFGDKSQLSGQRLDVVSEKGHVIYFHDGQAVWNLQPLLVGPTKEKLLLVEWPTGPNRSVVQVLRYLPGPFTKTRLAAGQVVEVGELPSDGAPATLVDVDGDGYLEVVTFGPAKEGMPTSACKSLVATANKWSGSSFVAIGQACKDDITRCFQGEPAPRAPHP